MSLHASILTKMNEESRPRLALTQVFHPHGYWASIDEVEGGGLCVVGSDFDTSDDFPLLRGTVNILREMVPHMIYDTYSERLREYDDGATRVAIPSPSAEACFGTNVEDVESAALHAADRLIRMENHAFDVVTEGVEGPCVGFMVFRRAMEDPFGTVGFLMNDEADLGESQGVIWSEFSIVVGRER